MGSERATQSVPTRLLLTRIPDSWSWMRWDLLVRLLPFTVAYAVIYIASSRSAWLGLGPGNLTAQLVFAAVASPVMFGAAAAVLPWLTRRRGAVRVPGGPGRAAVRAGFYAANGPDGQGRFRRH